MNKRLGAPAIVVATVAAAAGLFASPSNSAANHSTGAYCRKAPVCLVAVTATGPSPSNVKLPATELGLFGAYKYVQFHNTDSVTHTVVFANGLCSLTLAAGKYGTLPTIGGPGCNDNFLYYVGSYAYTVDGKFHGKVVMTPLPRSVTLTAQTHTVRGGTGLTLHGQVRQKAQGGAPPAPVVVLARHNRKQSFRPVATVRTRFRWESFHAAYGWKLKVQPDVTTTYIAEVTGQRLCYFPASRCAHPHGQVWTNATSRPFTVRTQH